MRLVKKTVRLIVQLLLLFYSYIKPSKGIPVLLYHETRVNDNNKTIPNIPLSVFREQMDYLYRRGYKTISSQEVVEIVRNKKKIPSKTVVITFDDGFKSNLEAFDIMKEYHFNGICFVATSFIGQTYNYMPFWLDNTDVKYATSSSKDQPFVFMSKDDLKKVSTQGHIEFFPHTHHHIDMISFSDDEICREIEESEYVLNIEGNHKVFSYPRGLYDERIKKILIGLGYDLSFAVKVGVITKDTDLLEIPRVNVPSEKYLFRLILTDKYRIYDYLSAKINK